MDIIIAGAGRVGFRLAVVLSVRHNVIIMDQNAEALEKLKESIDVLPIVGNIQDPATYAPLEGRNYDLFIAVTDVDEVNLIASLIAEETIRIGQKIVRLNHTFYAQSAIAGKLSIAHAVYPHILTAASIRALLEQTRANNVKSFSQTAMKLVSVRADFHHGTQVISPAQIQGKNLIVVGIERKKNFHLASEADVIRHEDMVYLFGDADAAREACGRLNHAMPRSIRNIVIFGADALGTEIARQLCMGGASVKMVEKDLDACHTAAADLQEHVMVINSKYGDARLYQDEGLGHADMMIAATPNDEENIIKCIEAREHGVGKVVAINNDIEYYHLMYSLGITVVRGPKTNAFYSILEAIGSSAVVNEKLFCGGAAICFIRHFPQECARIELPKTRMLAAYRITAESVTPIENGMPLAAGELMVLFCPRAREEEGRTWINAL